jgi:hypothetical protein
MREVMEWREKRINQSLQGDWTTQFSLILFTKLAPTEKSKGIIFYNSRHNFINIGHRTNKISKGKAITIN